MSLTQSDLQQIRSVVDDAILPLRNEVRALQSDIEEIYNALNELKGSSIFDKKFKKLSSKEKVLTLNAELITVANELGVTLPRP